MNQHEAVIEALEQLGGMATLGQLYEHVFKIPGCDWGTKTPFASIRRIVRKRPEIFRLKPGLYALTTKKGELEAKGIIAQNEKNEETTEVQKSNHTYYQGLLLILGKMKGYACWSPNQDRNKKFLNQPLSSVRTLPAIPRFSYDELVKRSKTIDVIWFNKRKMPDSLFEVEHSTDIQNSLLKFNDLQDFSSRMFIVSSSKRKKEFESKIRYSSFGEITGRVKFLSFEWLVKEYEHRISEKQHGLPF